MSKSQKWTPEQTEQAINAYVEAGNDNKVLETIAKEMGRTVQAVRSKLVAEDVYVKNAPRKVGGASSIRKVKIVGDIEQALGAESGDLASFEGATKAQLELMLELIARK